VGKGGGTVKKRVGTRKNRSFSSMVQTKVEERREGKTDTGTMLYNVWEKVSANQKNQ